ncbi:MAG TPA: hypothetical protein VGM32_13275, partial [Rhodopila sp.]
MRLHAEVPLVALLRLVHHGIARLVGVFRPRGALMIMASTIVPVEIVQPLLGQVPLHLVKQPPTQIVRFKQVAEAAHR